MIGSTGSKLLSAMTLVAGLSPAGRPLRAREDSSESGGPPRQEEIEQLRVNTAYVLGKGEFELDLVFGHIEAEERDVSSLTAELEFGLFTDWMLEAEIPVLHVNSDPGDTGTGFGDPELEVKYRMYEGGPLAASLLAAVVFPAGDTSEGTGSGLWAAEGALLFSIALPDLGPFDVVTHFEAGTEWVESEGVEEGFGNAALEVVPFESGLFLQLGVNSTFGEDDPAVSLVPGLQAALEVRGLELEVGLGVPIGLTEEAEDWGVLVDLEVEF